MRFWSSLQARLAITLGVLLTATWAIVASITAISISHEMDEVFDATLRETAERILPLAVIDVLGREEDGVGATQNVSSTSPHDEYFTYVVRDEMGRILVQSHSASPFDFPAYGGPGFSRTQTHRLYSDEAVQGTIRITVAEPLEHRREMAREIQMGLGFPLLLILPLVLLAVFAAVRVSLVSLRQLRERLLAQNVRDFSPLPLEDAPGEVLPLVEATNDLLARLQGAFDAERSFASNAAHELRTPLAGAIAQAQRLAAETSDPAAKTRAEDIESTLKRLTQLSEKLMQLARAEGGRMRVEQATDLREILRLVVFDFERSDHGNVLFVTCPETPVLSHLDPDMFAILCRNLIENALRYKTQGSIVKIVLTEYRTLKVLNDCPCVDAHILANLSHRFQRNANTASGSGLGLAIASTIMERAEGRFDLYSPIRGEASGFEAEVSVSH